MQFRSFAVLGLVVIICGTCGGCGVEYQATVNCSDCNGKTNTATSDWSCYLEDAEDQAESECGLPNTDSTVIQKSYYLSFIHECGEDRASPLPTAVNSLIRRAGLRAGLLPEPQVVEPADEPTCPPKKVDLKVTVFQDIPVPGCPGDIEVQVSYYKLISEGVTEYVTLSAMVPVGGSHEFLCIDAEVNSGTGKVGTIRVAVLTDLNCLGNPDLATASSYSQIPADGSSLECRADLNANIINSEITPPANPAAAAPGTAQPAVRQAQIPIPDPRFTPRDR